MNEGPVKFTGPSLVGYLPRGTYRLLSGLSGRIRTYGLLLPTQAC